jgi:hypothetical protein
MNTEKQKHPAPWTYDGHGVNDANGKRIAAVRKCLPVGHDARVGTMLAAAPALAEALRSLESAVADHCSGQWEESPEGWEAVQSKARAALALIDDTPNT